MLLRAACAPVRSLGKTSSQALAWMTGFASELSYWHSFQHDKFHMIVIFL